MFTVKTERMKMTEEAIARHNEQKRRRYLANRDSILALAAARRRAAKVLGEQTPEIHTPARVTVADGEEDHDIRQLHTALCFLDYENVEDPRTLIERDRHDNMEGIRLRLIWASSDTGDTGTVARTAVAVIRFAASEGKRWTDKALRDLHKRLSLAEGLTATRFEAARDTLSHELFVPL